MKLNSKHINLIKLFSFLFLLTVMVVLNHSMSSNKTSKQQTTENYISAHSNASGIATSTAQLPNKAEGSLPIKLITNLNSNFLFFVNYSYNLKSSFELHIRQKQFLQFYHKIQSQQLISYFITARSKDIQ